MTLCEICRMVAEVEAGLVYGEINFSYDNLMCAMKPGHPAEILDDILSILGWAVFEGEIPEREKVEEFYSELKLFKSSFKIKELKKPLDALKLYLSEGDRNDE